MAEITITSQEELDNLPDSFKRFTYIYIKSQERIIVRRARENSSVVARGNSSVEAWENSSVVARENSSVVARENSSVVARENSSVVARGNSSVVARENSSVEAWGNSSVEAWENSSVVARGNSSVEAWENSSVVAWENCCVRAQSVYASIILFAFAVCYLIRNAEVKEKSKTATIIRPVATKDVPTWLEAHGIKKTKYITLYKRVSKDFKTQEGTGNETDWSPGTEFTHPAWNPSLQECGEGKFHFCPTPYFCDEFRNKPDDRYVACRVPASELYAWENPSYPHKIAGRSGKVLYEVDRKGNKL